MTESCFHSAALACAIGLSLAAPAAADPAQRTSDGWERILSAGENTRFLRVATLPDGGIVAVGDARDLDARGDGLIVKLGEDGAADWTHRFDQRDTGLLWDVTQGPTGDLYAVGWTGNHADDLPGSWMARLGPEGQLRWARPVADSGNLLLHTITTTPDGQLLAAGSESAGNRETVLMGLDREGAITWSARPFAGQPSQVSDIAVTSMGRIIAVGRTRAGDASRALVAALGPDGRPIWQRQPLGGMESGLSAVTLGPDRAISAVGHARAPLGVEGMVGLLVRMTGSGETVWTRETETEVDLAGVAARPDGSVIAVGGTGLRVGDQAPYRGWKIELADSGDILDFGGYGPEPGSAFSDVAMHGADRVVVVGKVTTPRTRGRQGWVYLQSE